MQGLVQKELREMLASILVYAFLELLSLLHVHSTMNSTGNSAVSIRTDSNAVGASTQRTARRLARF